jgi:hypothetical protein
MFEEPATPAAGAAEEVAALLFLSLHCANTNTMASARNPFRMKFVLFIIFFTYCLLIIIRFALNEKAKKLDADAKEFQRKLENNGFATRERAEQEQMRLMKQQQELQALQQKLSDELASENQKNSLQLRDSINSFLKIYNQNKGYDLIISNTGFDNLLYANPAYNITQEIIDGLNARYTPSSVKK